jgi:hypothetical protein
VIEAGELRPESPLRAGPERAGYCRDRLLPDGSATLQVIDDEYGLNLRIAPDARAARP